MNNLEKTLYDIVIHLHPNYLKPEYKDRIDTENLDKKNLEKYFELLTSVSFAFKKIIKYELYFSEFYPETIKIRKTEALEHHVCAYLEDLDIFRNKVCYFLGVLKNDLKKIAINKSEIDVALNQFVEKVHEVFKNVSKNRHPHHHKGTRFLDKNLVDANAMHILAKEDNPYRDMLSPEFTEELRRKENEFFEKAKLGWIGLAKNNSDQLTGFIDEVFKRNRDLIYKFLYIRSANDVFAK